MRPQPYTKKYRQMGAVSGRNSSGKKISTVYPIPNGQL